MLRPYQQHAVDSCLNHIGFNNNHGVCVMPTGSGKSHAIAAISERLAPHGKVLILSHRKELLAQNKAKFTQPDDIAIISAGLGEKTFNKQITIGGIQTVYNCVDRLENIKYVLVDECFPNYFKVDGTLIKDLKVGDKINSYNHQTNRVEKKEILAIAKRKISDKMCRLKLSNGLIIESTLNHPFYEQTKGYINASQAKVGDVFWLLPSLQSFCSPNIKKSENLSKSFWAFLLFKKMFVYLQGNIIKFTNEAKQSYVKSRDKKKNERNFKKDRAQAKNSRREWKTRVNPATKFIQFIGKRLGFGVYCQYKWWKKIWLPNSLQNRCCQPYFKNSYRSRWKFPFFKKSTRLKERKLFKRVRVESVEIFKPRSDKRYREMQGDGFVYNLEIKDNNNYFCEKILVHNCHLLNNTKQTSRYWEVVNFLKSASLLGFTATPFRLEGGRNKPLTWGKICYSLGYEYLIQNKFLSPLKNKVSTTIDTSKVEVKNGEFLLEQLEDAAIDKDAIRASVEKIIQYAENFNRKSILVFCSGIKHIEILAFALAAHRFRVEKLTSKTPKEERKILLEKFKTGEVRCILNCEVLTTGFDAPNIDMIAVLRPTKSKALHEQILGRGVRIAENKTECIILDMAGNLEEHGGLGSPLINNPKISSSEQVKKDYKICPACEEQIKVNERNCPECGFYFEPQQREVTHNLEPDINSDILGKKLVKVYEVDFCEFKEHISKEKKKSLKISYYCGYNLFNEWIVPFHENEWASNKGLQIANEFGLTGLDYKELVESAKLGYKKPVKILVEPDGKYDRIVNRIWEQETEDLDDCIPF